VFEEGLKPVTIGVVAGLVASVVLGRGMASLLFEVRPSDLGVMAAASAVVLLATVIACLAPARRAAHAVLRTDS